MRPDRRRHRLDPGRTAQVRRARPAKLVICGISAGFALVFGTPIAGSIFGVEVLFVGGILYEVLLPSFIAGITAYHISAALGISYFYHPVRVVPVFSEVFFIKVIAAGIFFGLCSILLIEALRASTVLARRIKIWEPLKGLIGGAALIVLTLVFSARYLGLGLDHRGGLPGRRSRCPGSPSCSSLCSRRSPSTSAAAAASSRPSSSWAPPRGPLFASLLGLDPATFAAMGMVGVLAGAANTPIAASLLAMEMFGPAIAPYATVACVISFLMTGHRSVYPSQVLSVRKSESLRVELGRDIEDIEASFIPRTKGLSTRVLMLFRTLARMFRQRGM